jgi:hypothetical protein
MKQIVSPNFNAVSFNPEPEATAVLTRDCRPETAGAAGFGLNKEAAGRVRFTKHSRLRLAVNDKRRIYFGRGAVWLVFYVRIACFRVVD